MRIQTEHSILISPAKADDADRWDDFVARHPMGSPYHRWAWRQALEQGYSLQTHYRVAKVSDGSIVGVLPAARVPRLAGQGSLCSLPYCDLGGPLATEPQISRQLLESLQDEKPEVHDVRGTAKAQDDCGVKLETLQPGQKVRLTLDLPRSSEELLAGFKSKHRSQINKASKNGLSARVRSGLGPVAKFYNVFTRNMRDLGSPTHSLQWFEAIAKCYGSDCLIGLVELNGKVLGGGIVLIAGNRAAIPWASTLREYNSLAPNMLLYWSLLAASIDRGCMSFDFGRSSFGEGTYRFKTQWGATPIPLDWHTHGKSGYEPPAENKLAAFSGGRLPSIRPLIEFMWRRMPLPLTVAVGSRLRPYVSL